MSSAAPSLTHVTPDDPEYLRLCGEEAAFWASDRAGFCQIVDDLGESVWERVTNRRFTGDERTRWYETIAMRGEFQEGLFLGTSGLAQDARILEMNPLLHATFCDIAESSLVRWEAELGTRFTDRVQTQVADLNFVDLPERAYDLVVSSSTLHHIVNLEHIARQINRTLTPGGLFVLQDCVAESMYRFSPEKKRIFELIVQPRHRATGCGRESPASSGTTRNAIGLARFAAYARVTSWGCSRHRTRSGRAAYAGTISGLLLHATPADGASMTVGHRLQRRLDAW